MSEHSKSSFLDILKYAIKHCLAKVWKSLKSTTVGLIALKSMRQLFSFLPTSLLGSQKNLFSLSFLHKLLGYMMVLEAAVMDR